MCLIAFKLQEHPVYKLILIANRDEAYSRPTAAAAFWTDHPHVLAGRDLFQMGTWLGITKEGRFAALTNAHTSFDALPNQPVSRGKIVQDYLTTDQPIANFLAHLQINRSNYAGFNLLIGDNDHLLHFNNLTNEVTNVPPGIHGLSNASINNPWPKVTKGKSYLRNFTEKNKKINPYELLPTFTDTSITKTAFSPLVKPTTPMESKLQNSPIFIKTPNYGTVSTTVLFIDHDNNVTFNERSYDKKGTTGDVHYLFTIQ